MRTYEPEIDKELIEHLNGVEAKWGFPSTAGEPTGLRVEKVQAELDKLIQGTKIESLEEFEAKEAKRLQFCRHLAEFLAVAVIMLLMALIDYLDI